MEIERGTIQVQEQSAEHRAKMWKVRTLQQLDCGFKQLLDMYNILCTSVDRRQAFLR